METPSKAKSNIPIPPPPPNKPFAYGDALFNSVQKQKPEGKLEHIFREITNLQQQINNLDTRLTELQKYLFDI